MMKNPTNVHGHKNKEIWLLQFGCGVFCWVFLFVCLFLFGFFFCLGFGFFFVLVLFRTKRLSYSINLYQLVLMSAILSNGRKERGNNSWRHLFPNVWLDMVQRVCSPTLQEEMLLLNNTRTLWSCTCSFQWKTHLYCSSLLDVSEPQQPRVRNLKGAPKMQHT